jgi:hypothetical protein
MFDYYNARHFPIIVRLGATSPPIATWHTRLCRRFPAAMVQTRYMERPRHRAGLDRRPPSRVHVPLLQFASNEASRRASVQLIALEQHHSNPFTF